MKFQGGIRDNGTPWYFYIKQLPAERMLPKKVTAVCGLISPGKEINKFIIVKNKRGYDIPGGHIEFREKPLVALIRETKEEACAKIVFAYPIILLESDYYSEEKTYIFIYSGVAVLYPFISSAEVLERRIVTSEELLSLYYGNIGLMKHMLDIHFSMKAKDF
jgi:8-oxo-dGTP pyrophosphatase MutT (NUDIX family)